MSHPHRMRLALVSTGVGLLVGIGAAGCGGDEPTAATTTVTVTAPAPPPAAAAAGPSGASGATGAAASPDAAGATGATGPPLTPLPAGIVGIDGRYALKLAATDAEYKFSDVRFSAYDEQSNADTTCDGGTCSVRFRLGLRSGGAKVITLEADPDRTGTYVGTAGARVDCVGGGNRPARDRVAVRGSAPATTRGRQVATRLVVFVTTTARCPGSRAGRNVVTLKGRTAP